MSEAKPPAHAVLLPETTAGCRERLASVRSEIAAIRVQIATADLRRQAHKQALDAQWFHRAKTALRLKNLEAAQLSAHLSALGEQAGAAAPQRQRERFKDALIEAMRAECDDARWAALLQRARRQHAHQEPQHG